MRKCHQNIKPLLVMSNVTKVDRLLPKRKENNTLESCGNQYIIVFSVCLMRWEV